jgi:bifunctional non-homologous end joining protein LigD
VAGSPFEGRAKDERGVVWVRPDLVVEIEFRAWTASRTLRHASFVGLREDKSASEVVAEQVDETVNVDDAPKVSKAVEKKSRRTAVKPPTTSVKFTNPDKVLWPDNGFTKRQLLDYYAVVWPLMRDFVVNRPLSLLREPDGIAAHQFFQKHASPGMHSAVRTQRDKDGEELIFIHDFDGLAALVQLGTVEIHLWGATIDAVETPDQVIFDLDPDEGVPIARVRDAAVAVRDRLAELGFQSWLKTSGGKGFHVVMPIQPKADWARVKAFARDFAKAFQQAEPERYTATLAKAARKGRIFIDYLRNGRGATAIAPYSTRAKKGAAVSMPVSWKEIEGDLKPDQFRAASVLATGVDQLMHDGQMTASLPGTMVL